MYKIPFTLLTHYTKSLSFTLLSQDSSNNWHHNLDTFYTYAAQMYFCIVLNSGANGPVATKRKSKAKNEHCFLMSWSTNQW